MMGLRALLLLFVNSKNRDNVLVFITHNKD